MWTDVAFELFCRHVNSWPQYSSFIYFFFWPALWKPKSLTSLLCTGISAATLFPLCLWGQNVTCAHVVLTSNKYYPLKLFRAQRYDIAHAFWPRSKSFKAVRRHVNFWFYLSSLYFLIRILWKPKSLPLKPHIASTTLNYFLSFCG